MLRCSALSLVVLSAIVLVGCESSGESRDLEFELRKVSGERDAYEQRLIAEQARTQALQQRMEVKDAKSTATRAENVRLTARLKELQQNYDALKAVFDKIENKMLTRPDVPVSPLPETVDAALQAYAEELSDRVVYDRARGALSFANDRLFDPGSATVRSDAVASLHELAGVLTLVPASEYEIVLVGHTDASPITKPETKAQHPTNWHLSVHRAIAVQQVLVEAGVPAPQTGVMGYGPHRPVGQDNARNRRVEVFIIKRGAIQSFDPVKTG